MTAVAFVAALLGKTLELAIRAAACERLVDLRLLGTTITSADAVTGGLLAIAAVTRPVTNVPPFCRVVGVVAPTGDSHIVFEVWLPLENWDQRLTGVGNGGFGGVVNFGGLAAR